MAKKQMSREGFNKLEKELEYLITIRRAEVAQKLKEARGFGDLSENAEYDEAKNEQGILESQIAEMEATIANVEVVDDDAISLNEVGVGSVVKIKRVGQDKIEKLQVVGTTEADPYNNKISDESPIGAAVIKKKVGEIFEVNVPAGIIKYEVVEITKE